MLGLWLGLVFGCLYLYVCVCEHVVQVSFTVHVYYAYNRLKKCGGN